MNSLMKKTSDRQAAKLAGGCWLRLHLDIYYFNPSDPARRPGEDHHIVLEHILAHHLPLVGADSPLGQTRMSARTSRVCPRLPNLTALYD